MEPSHEDTPAGPMNGDAEVQMVWQDKAGRQLTKVVAEGLANMTYIVLNTFRMNTELGEKSELKRRGFHLPLHYVGTIEGGNIQNNNQGEE